MEEYALNDVRYLLPLAEILEKQLKELGRWAWYGQSRDAMVQSARQPRERDLEKAWRVNGSSKLPPREAAVLRALWHWRDAEASAWDRPTFHVISNERMIEAACAAVAGHIYEVHRMPPPRYARMKEAPGPRLNCPRANGRSLNASANPVRAGRPAASSNTSGKSAMRWPGNWPLTPRSSPPASP